MAVPTLDFRNTNSLWCSVMVETWARCGLTHAVISPGSRSTPLTFALAAHPGIEAIPIVDERSAAFFALGLARELRRPTLLLCTSGSAAAHYFPAVIEAQESNVPLIVCSADRPPEMRECSSGQTIDQLKLFGSHVNWFHEVAVPEPTLPLLRYLRQTAAHAYGRALLPAPGPIHLNAPFRDPLPPIEDDSARALVASLDEDFFSHLSPPGPLPASAVIWQKPTTTRGLIVAGPESVENPAEYAANMVAFADALGWPILADALSPLRHYTARPQAVVAGYDAILRSERLARELAPRTVLCLGGWPTSKVLRAWLESSGAEIALVSPQVANRDALHGRTRQILARADQLRAETTRSPDVSYRNLWSTAEQRVQAAFQRAFSGVSAQVEPRLTRELAELLPIDATLYVASSMPIRDVEYFWPANARRVRFRFNRGANGIDGTLSTALGVAHACGGPAYLLTGDLAFLHDTNGLLTAAKFRGSLTILLVNNNGGGIFQHLPVAGFEPPFETFFATPQQVDFAKLCAAYGVAHHQLGRWDELAALLQGPPSPGVRVIEMKTDRRADAAFRKQLFADAARAAESPG